MNFDRNWTTVKQTKKREHDKNIKLEIDMNSVTSKSEEIHNDKILIEIGDVQK